jgi:isopenicillin-N N-acyltransferase-like protein
MADGAALAELAPPPGTGSAGRQERLDRLLAERPPETIDDVMAILRDHESSPDAICLHSADPNGDEAWSVLFSMVCDVDAGRMWVAVGNPCECQYEEVDLSDVL